MVFASQGRHVLCHEAMGTVFKVHLMCAEPTYARQAASAMWAELDRLEQQLSRFVPSSDINRINRLLPGQSTRVHADTFDCLRTALHVQELTRGAFDVAYASGRATPSQPRFALDAEEKAVRVLAQRVQLDLGGIGKGFALDRLAAVLADWEIPAALLGAGASTWLACGAPENAAGWTLVLGPEHDLRRVRLKDGSLSGSGTAVRGEHIIDPRTARPPHVRCRAWAAAPTAAEADALSTAFMILSEPEIRALCRRWPDLWAWLLTSPCGTLTAIHGESQGRRGPAGAGRFRLVPEP